MKKLLTSMVLGCLLTFGVQAHALSITPSTAAYATGVTNPATPNTSQDAINDVLAGLNLGAAELYKMNADDTNDTGTLKDSYNTVYPTTDPSGATITFTGGPIIGDPKFLLVKDGNQTPWWYLFNLTTLWNGMDTLELSGFWPGNGSISHVALYGNSTPPPPSVPEPGTLLLLGGGLLGLAVYGKRRMNKES